MVTSPPYWGLRDYGLPAMVWGGDPECEHVWNTVEHDPNPHGDDGNSAGLDGGTATQAQTRIGKISSAFCRRCNAWRGCLGLEPTPAMYVEHLVEVFREVWRVLRDDGTVWLNLGDSYSSGNSGVRDCALVSRTGFKHRSRTLARPGTPDGLKAKDLVGIPWQVAFALRADGWWLRRDVIWHKPNVMPESVQDRPTTAHEYLFLLTKAERYYYDAEAIKEPQTGNAHSRGTGGVTPKGMAGGACAERMSRLHQVTSRYTVLPGGRNKRSVWTVPTRGYSGAHFAAFPPDLVEPCVLAGTSAAGCCVVCGAPWERVVEREVKSPPDRVHNNPFKHDTMTTHGEGDTTLRSVVESHTLGWRPTCSHGTKPIRCIVLDPFCGTATVGEVCIKHGRDFVGLDLSGRYLKEMAARRLRKAGKVEIRREVAGGVMVQVGLGM